MTFYNKEKYIYNEKLKNEFINNSDYAEDTKTIMKYTFYKTYSSEKQLDKDVYKFNKNQLESLLGGMNATEASIRTHVSILANYIDWTIKEKQINSLGYNYLKSLPQFKKDGLLQFVNQVGKENRFLDTEDLDQITNMKFGILENYQDAVVVQLLRESLNGDKLCELRNLRVSDVDFKNNIIKIRDANDNIVREITPIHENTMKIIKNAIDEDEYVKYDKKEESNMKAKYLKLLKTKYVLRKSNVGRITSDVLGYQTVISRINTLKRVLSNKHISSNTLWWSGVFEYAKKLKEENNGELERDDIVKICKRFNYFVEGYEYDYIHKMRKKLSKHV